MASRSAAISPARAAAFEVLVRVFEEGAYADRALRSAAEPLDDRDRGLAQRLAFGAVQRRRTLDHAIETLGRRRVERLDPPVRAALRLGAYQLAFVDGVARYAAVNESVELVRRAGLERAVAFTNAVLRRVADGIRPLVDALPDGSTTEAALKHSYPDWIAETWWRDLGADEARALMRTQNEAGATVLRLVRGEIDGMPDHDVPGAWHVDRIDAAALEEGRIWPQSAASQLVGLAVGSRARERVLDLCAAPGGKATMLSGDVTAVDVNEARARELELTARRLGASNVTVVVADGRALPAELDGFDGHSSTPPARPRRAEPQAGSALARRTPPGAAARAASLRRGAGAPRWLGRLLGLQVNADESEAVVDASGLAVDATLADEWPQFRHARRPEFLQTLPHRDGTAGFFVARLRC